VFVHISAVAFGGELAANLRSDGYQPLQNLVVRKGDKKGRYFVTAGERRRLALLSLAEAGEIAADFAVECKERTAEDATAISLDENVTRMAMLGFCVATVLLGSHGRHGCGRYLGHFKEEGR